MAGGDRADAGGGWQPPGKDCGLCGSPGCADFTAQLRQGSRQRDDCPFYRPEREADREVDHAACRAVNREAPAPPPEKPDRGTDVLGHPWDFVLDPLPGEPSARKIVLPFRPDLVERWNIAAGDIVLGRPFSAGCPVQHVLKVIRADPTTGVLDTWVVGPAFSRGRRVRDVGAYHMLGFEGLAVDRHRDPVFGVRHVFLPGFCMMHINHTGLVNLVLGKEVGLHVRLEDIHLLAGPEASPPPGPKERRA